MSTQYIKYPASGGGIATYANLAAFPAAAADGAVGVALDTHIIYEYNLGITTWQPVASNAAYVGGGAAITALTGEVTASGPGSAAATIAANAVTNAKLAQMAAHTFKGNNTAATADPLDLTRAELSAEIEGTWIQGTAVPNDAAAGVFTFTNILNAVISGGNTVVTYSADGGGWGFSGVESTETFTNDGYVEFKPGTVGTDMMVGLQSGTGYNYTDLDAGVYCGGSYQIYEGATFVGAFGPISVGDVVRVERSGSDYIYSLNGSPVHTSVGAATPATPLHFWSSNNGAGGNNIYDIGGSFATGATTGTGIDGQYYRRTTNEDVYFRTAGVWAVVGNLSAVGTWISGSGAPLDQSGSASLTFGTPLDTTLTNVDTTITFDGSGAWGTCGVASTDTFTGDGYIEYTLGSVGAGVNMIIGLQSAPGVNYTDIDFGAQYAGGGSAIFNLGSLLGTFGPAPVIGDTFRIARIGSDIVFSANSVVFHTLVGAVSPSTPLNFVGGDTAAPGDFIYDVTSSFGTGASTINPGTGIDGQYYRRTTNGDVYFRTAGAWALFPLGTSNLIATGQSDSVIASIKGFSTQTADLTQWKDGSDNILDVVDYLGRVGIGTATPSSGLVFGSQFSTLLHVKGVSNVCMAFQATGGGQAGMVYAEGNSQGIMALADSSATADYRILDIQSAGGVMYFRRINDAYTAQLGVSLTIDYLTNPNGNLGVGITSPTALLHLGGTYDQVRFKIKADGTQTVNIVEITDAADVLLATIPSDGITTAATDLTPKSYVDSKTLLYIIDGPNSSIIEGDTANNVASGTYSHAEGSFTEAQGDYSHSEGSGGVASGVSSHVEGSDCTATGAASHAEGSSADATGDYSHAEGSSCTASGIASHAEGSSCTASGNASHSGGETSTAAGLFSFAHGRKALTGANDGAHVITDSQDFTTTADAADQFKARFQGGFKVVAGGGANNNDGVKMLELGPDGSVGLSSNISGIVTLTAGAATVSNTNVTANSRIMLTSQLDGGTVGFLRITARTVATDFTITSSSVLDTSDVAWIILETA